MNPLALKTAFKVSLAATLAWIISAFFDFPSSFLSALLAGMSALAGPVGAWYLMTRGTVVMAIAFTLGALESVFWGRGYFTVFLCVLLAGYLWHFLQLQGYGGNFLSLAMKMSLVVVYTNSSDPITLSFYEIMNQLIGMTTGLVVGLVFWPMANQNIRQRNFSDFLTQTEQILRQSIHHYLDDPRPPTGEPPLLDREPNLDQALVRLRALIQSSEKFIRANFYDLGDRQLNHLDWLTILQSQKKIYLHLAAVVRCSQKPPQTTLPPPIAQALQTSTQAIADLLPHFAELTVTPALWEVVAHCDQICQAQRAIIVNYQQQEHLNPLSLQDLLTLLGLCHRLHRLQLTLNQWVNYPTPAITPSPPNVLSPSRV